MEIVIAIVIFIFIVGLQIISMYQQDQKYKKGWDDCKAEAIYWLSLETDNDLKNQMRRHLDGVWKRRNN